MEGRGWQTEDSRAHPHSCPPGYRSPGGMIVTSGGLKSFSVLPPPGLGRVFSVDVDVQVHRHMCV